MAKAGAGPFPAKRKLRLVVALTAAVLLATALIYTSFSASTEASKPSEIKPGRSYELTGKVVDGSGAAAATRCCACVCATARGPFDAVAYTGAVPDLTRPARAVR